MFDMFHTLTFHLSLTLCTDLDRLDSTDRLRSLAWVMFIVVFFYVLTSPTESCLHA